MLVFHHHSYPTDCHVVMLQGSTSRLNFENGLLTEMDFLCYFKDTKQLKRFSKTIQ